MNIADYIASGILELYIAGLLSEKENEEVYKNAIEHPEILQELLSIENAIMQLTSSVAPESSFYSFNRLIDEIEKSKNTGKVKSLNWNKYAGWAASIVLAGGLIWMVAQNTKLKEQLETVKTSREYLEQQIEIANKDLQEAQKLIDILRDRDILKIPLVGQQVYPDAFAAVYWDKSGNTIYLDAQGLPEPPKGKVYQVWSLTLDPLTPTSLGVISNFSEDDNKIFSISNPNKSEAFGITLEPKGGSETPTLDQLYTLGTVDTKP